MKIIIGLGNKGKRYDRTYHNVGFMVVDKLCASLGGEWKTGSNFSEEAKINIDGEDIILAKPLTFMNESGRAVISFLKKYPHIDPAKDIIICYDDLDLAPGKLRVKEVGGPGTHNGMKSVFEAFGSKSFRRVRVGIGERPEDVSLVDFVLSRITADSDVFDAVEEASSILERFIYGYISFDQMMLQINSKYK